MAFTYRDRQAAQLMKDTKSLGWYTPVLRAARDLPNPVDIGIEPYDRDYAGRYYPFRDRIEVMSGHVNSPETLAHELTHYLDYENAWKEGWIPFLRNLVWDDPEVIAREGQQSFSSKRRFRGSDKMRKLLGRHAPKDEKEVIAELIRRSGGVEQR